MKTSILLSILALSLTLSNCSNKKETVVEETQEQIQKRLEKEEGENLILGTWKLIYIYKSQKLVADSIGIYKAIFFDKKGNCTINYKDASSEYAKGAKYISEGTNREGLGLKRYIFTIDDIYNQMAIYKGNYDTLFASSTKIEGASVYVKLKQ